MVTSNSSVHRGHVFIKSKVFVCLMVFSGSACVSNTLYAQDPQRFNKEVIEIKAKDSTLTSTRHLILFTGSSSIRLWKDVRTRFEGYNVWNTGFGGSQMSDMFYYADDLIIPYHPDKVFIYEGDNDIAEGKKADDILKDAKKLIAFIRPQLRRKTMIYFITPKPSIKRWELRDTYVDYITKLKAYASTQRKIEVIDVWTPMLDQNGNVKYELFLEDNLHMNEKGYDIWTKTLMPYVSGKK
jgi:hypothetical protein